MAGTPAITGESTALLPLEFGTYDMIRSQSCKKSE